MINRPSPQQRSSSPRRRRRRLLGVISDRQCCVPRRPTSVRPSSAERVQRPTPADNVALLAFVAERRPCSSRSIFPGSRARSSKPVATARADRMMGRTNRQTGGQTDGRSTVSYCASGVNTPTWKTSISCRRWTRATRCLTRVVLYTEMDAWCD